MSDDARRARRLHGLRRDRSAPRVEELDALLRQVDDLRLTLETDLSLAASALEACAPELALDVVDSDRAELASFERRALENLDDLELRSHRRTRSWIPAHAASIAVAAGLVGLLAGVVPQAVAPRQPATSNVSAGAALERLQELAEEGDASEIREASAALHAQLAAVVAAAKTDPAAARTALLLLSYEQHAIVSSGDVAELGDVLRQSQALARKIRAALPVSVRSSLPRPAAEAPIAEPQPTASPRPTTSVTPAPRPSASPSAAPSPTKSPTGSPKPTSSPRDDGNPLPSQPLQP